MPRKRRKTIDFRVLAKIAATNNNNETARTKIPGEWAEAGWINTDRKKEINTFNYLFIIIQSLAIL